MKTTLKKILAIGLLLPSLFLVACGKDNGGSSTTTTVTTGYWSNGVCYANGTTTPIASTGCAVNTGTTLVANGQVINNICYINNQPVYPVSLCYNNTGTTNGVGACYGLYRWNSYTVQCNGADCRNFTLFNLTTQQTQVCQ